LPTSRAKWRARLRTDVTQFARTATHRPRMGIYVACPGEMNLAVLRKNSCENKFRVRDAVGLLPARSATARKRQKRGIVFTRLLR
jgi:hypothetical protein